MADARATEEETEVDEMSIVRTGSIANHVNAKKFEMALHKSESLADYPAEKVWKHVDVDKSGGLDKKEFFEMYQLLQKHVDTQQKELVEEKHKIEEEPSTRTAHARRTIALGRARASKESRTTAGSGGSGPAESESSVVEVTVGLEHTGPASPAGEAAGGVPAEDSVSRRV